MPILDVTYNGINNLRASIDKGELSPTEILKMTFDRIARVNPVVNAIVALREDAALAEAIALENLDVKKHGPLYGIPFLAKDLNETKDMLTTLGSRAFRENKTDFEAVVISRLRVAGGILIGKTNTPEFGLRPTTENKLFGATKNPWNPAYSPGGSTGGGAAALACGMVPIAQGNDGGGSCRIPASCCAVVGLKPTRGRVPWAPAAFEYWAGLATNGPMARTVKDAALMLDVMSGPVVGEPYNAQPPQTTFHDACRRAPRRLRLAYWTHPSHGSIDPEVKETFFSALDCFSSMGHELEEDDPGLHGFRDAFVTIIASNTAALARIVPPDLLDELESSTLLLIKEGLRLSAAEYCMAVNTIRNESARVMTFWDQYDFLLTPTLTQLPPRLGAMPTKWDLKTIWTEYLDWLAFTYPFNCTGQPAISLPCGWSKAKGLPIGLQIIGRFGNDEGVLSLASQFEEARPWHHSYNSLRLTDVTS
jgi:amidase